MEESTRKMLKRIVRTLLIVLVAFPVLGAEPGHEDPVSGLVISLAIILIAAKIGGDLAQRVGQPSVLGELLIGVVMGNLTLIGYDGFEHIAQDQFIDMFARLGVLLLLFEVGLESTVDQMLKVGLVSTVVALLGVAAPFGLGWLVGAWLLPDESAYAHAFLGATLCATSVGITARVLQDLNSSKTDEARIILGAAVIDDVLGLVVLAVVTGIITAANVGTTVSLAHVGGIIGKAAIFLVGSLVIGVLVSKKLFTLASRLQARGVLLAIGLSFCFFLSWLAGKVGLAPIVGAFAAGLILEDAHYIDFKNKGEHELEHLIHPITLFIVPVFFVLMGMRTDLTAFTSLGVVGLASALTVAAIVGKQACSLGVFKKGIDRLTVGIGMVPRGEVGLIFANIGLGLVLQGERVIDASIFSAIIVMVIVTTLITPPALKWSLRRAKR
jgi:Kef-type K+ transport system membrane component KefB